MGERTALGGTPTRSVIRHYMDALHRSCTCSHPDPCWLDGGSPAGRHAARSLQPWPGCPFPSTQSWRSRIYLAQQKARTDSGGDSSGLRRAPRRNGFSTHHRAMATADRANPQLVRASPLAPHLAWKPRGRRWAASNLPSTGAGRSVRTMILASEGTSGARLSDLASRHCGVGVAKVPNDQMTGAHDLFVHEPASMYLERVPDR